MTKKFKINISGDASRKMSSDLFDFDERRRNVSKQNDEKWRYFVKKRRQFVEKKWRFVETRRRFVEEQIQEEVQPRVAVLRPPAFPGRCQSSQTERKVSPAPGRNRSKRIKIKEERRWIKQFPYNVNKSQKYNHRDSKIQMQNLSKNLKCWKNSGPHRFSTSIHL